MDSKTNDGINSLLPREFMCEGAKKLRDAYNRVPGAPLLQREFGYYCLERWYEQGLDPDTDKRELFGFDLPGGFGLGRLGWCEAAFVPDFEEEIIEDRGDTEVVRDKAGRHVLYFKGRRSGFMPEYVDHPVKDMKTWEENVKWRLAVDAPGRFEGMEKRIEQGKEAAAEGKIVSQGLIGGYMYLRSLVGPEGALYMFYDSPDLIHDCMKTWFELSDAVIAKHQEHLTLDEIFFAEDICYNQGPLISPDMMREFLFPYYQQLISNVRSRQIDKDRHLFMQIDTDGFANPTIPVYQEIGMDVMSPFEVASGCDVVEVGKQYPELVISGGIDKRILATTKEAIDKELERILPVMRERGGYIPTCDHGVPEEVSLENYMHYRKRSIELGVK